MITSKELKHVQTNPKFVPFPGIDYSEEAIENLRVALNLFNKIYKGNKYNIIFSNNESVDLEIHQSNLAHMLGIDFKKLLTPLFNNFRQNILGINPTEKISSYELLNAILENSNKVIEFDNRGTLNALNYYKVRIKSDIFSKLGDLTNFNYGCINFDKNKFLENANIKVFHPNSTKYLYIASDEAICPYFLMGILPDRSIQFSNKTNEEAFKTSEDAPYIVETLFAPEQPQNFFADQEVIIPTQVLKINEKEMLKSPANAAKKRKILKEYENIIRLYNIKNNLNIYADYVATLSEEEKGRKLNKSL